MQPEGEHLGERLLPLKDVELKTGIKRSTIYRRISAGTFPAPLSLGPGTVRWRLSDVDAWIESLSKAAIGVKAREATTSEEEVKTRRRDAAAKG